MKNTRNNTIDIIKGLTIILVVIGHCIQYGSGTSYMINGLFFDNLLFKIIYSFHMPVFMLVSGFLFYYSINKYTIKELITKKIKRLVIPLLIWGLLYTIFFINYNLSGLSLLKNAISIYGTSFWFIQAIIFSIIITTIINKIFKDNVFVMIFILILFFIIPDNYNLSLYKFTSFYFVIGYTINKYNLITKYNQINYNYRIGLFIISLLLFVYLISMYDYNSYIYTSGMNILTNSYQIFINLYRWIIGLIGSYCYVIVIRKFVMIFGENKLLIKFSKASLLVYILDCFINKILIRCGFVGFNLFLVVIESLIVLIICMISYIIISNNKYLSKYLIGE